MVGVDGEAERGEKADSSMFRLPRHAPPSLVALPRTPGVRLLSASSDDIQKVQTHVQGVLEREMLIPVGAPVLVSVSGGADSIALLRVLLALHPRWRWRLNAVHFNHGLRPESEAEEAFVRALAKEHGVPLHVCRLPPTWAGRSDGEALSAADLDVAADDSAVDQTKAGGASVRGGGGPQARMRAWRRAQSLTILRTLEDGEAATAEAIPSLTGVRGQDEWGSTQDDWGGVGRIALGHHADDQLETLLLKMLRGAHLSNLHGMRTRAGAFVRPLLGVHKVALTNYLRALGQEWMEDASNQSPKYKRNRVRLQLVPLLSELAGSAEGLLARVGDLEEQSGQLRQWLEHTREVHLAADPFWHEQKAADGAAHPTTPHGLSVRGLLAHPPLVQDELLRVLVRSGPTGDAGASVGRADEWQPPAVSFAALRKLRAQLLVDDNDWTLDLSRHVSVTRVGDLLALGRGRAPQAGDATAAEGTDAQARVGLVCPGPMVATPSSSLRIVIPRQPRETTPSRDSSQEEVEAPPLVLYDSEGLCGAAGWGSGGDAAASIAWQVARSESSPSAEDGLKGGGGGRVVAEGAPPAAVVRLHNLADEEALEVRTWREGDRFHPAWRQRSISVASFLRGQKVPLEARRSVPLVCRAGTAEVLAVFPNHVARDCLPPCPTGARQPSSGAAEDGDALWVAFK